MPIWTARYDRRGAEIGPPHGCGNVGCEPALSDRYGDRYVLEFEISGPRGAGAHGLLRGQVGTVVELLDGAYEVEFSDDEARRTQSLRWSLSTFWFCIIAPSTLLESSAPSLAWLAVNNQ